MVDRHAIHEDMQVLGSDGGVVGRAAGLSGDRLRIKGTPGAGDGERYEIPASWIDRVDEHVHLNRETALVRETWTPAAETTQSGAAGSAGPAHGTTSTPETGLPKGKNRLPWIIVGIGILIALFLLVRGLTYALDGGHGTDQTHPAAAGASEAGNTQ